MGSNLQPRVPTESEVRSELDRILRSREFAGAERLSRFLKFVVERTLSGDRESLKESIIGIEVFDRGSGYDPKSEPIVRTEARRLRSKLDEYYETTGRGYSLRISVPKGGYIGAFEARPQPVVFSRSEAPVVEPAPPVSSAPGPPRRGFWIGALVVAIVVLIVIVIVSNRPARARPDPVLRTITSYPGSQREPALSPDGSQIAFVWGGESNDNADIYVAMASGGTPRRITSDPLPDEYPAWSPDGSEIAFVRDNHSLMLTNPLGGNERRVTSAYTTRLAWTKDGKRLIFSDWLPDKRRLVIYEVELASGARRQITTAAADAPGDVSPDLSPDGREVGFLRCAGASCDVYSIHIAGGELHRITNDNCRFHGLTWAPDGRSIIFSARRNGGPYLLWRAATSGHSEPEHVPISGEDASFPSFGRSQGSRLVYEQPIRDSNIWRLDLDAAGAPQPPRRIVASTRLDSSVKLSPDGRSIVFESDRTGHAQIWKADSEGRNVVAVTNFQLEDPGSPRWSPDGSRIAFDVSGAKGSAIFVADAAGGVVQQWTEWRQAARPSWSRDGQWIYFSDAGSGGGQMFKISAADRRRIQQVGQTGGTEPTESPDGKTIYYVFHGSLWKIPTSGGTPAIVIADVRAGWWDVGVKGIYYVDIFAGVSPGAAIPKTPKAVFLLPFDSTKPATIATISGEIINSTPDFSVSFDGRTMLFSILETSTSQIRMLEGL